MNITLNKKIKQLTHNVVNSIAFYPTIISAILLLLSIGMAYIEDSGFSHKTKDLFPFMVLESEEAARAILSTIAGGLISLMVFSFSMVMIVLNMTSSNYSPRLLPGLITNKSHQIVLGFYVGTIIYALILLINIRSIPGGYSIPSIGIFFGVMLTIFCLSLFIYFIHSISLSIQIEQIIEKIFQATLRKIKSDSMVGHLEDPYFNDNDWHSIRSDTSGYLQQISQKEFMTLAKEEDLKARTVVPLGNYVYKGDVFLEVNKEVPDGSELDKKIQQVFYLYPEENFKANYLIGFKHLKEVAVKALSPGINDPGTANKAINYLTNLFLYRLGQQPYKTYSDNNDIVRLEISSKPFSELLYFSFMEILEYGKSNPFIVENILNSVEKLLRDAKDKKHTDVLFRFTGDIAFKCRGNNFSSMEKEHLNHLLKKINKLKDSDKISLF